MKCILYSPNKNSHSNEQTLHLYSQLQRRHLNNEIKYGQLYHNEHLDVILKPRQVGYSKTRILRIQFILLILSSFPNTYYIS